MTPMEPQAVAIARLLSERVKRPSMLPVADWNGRLRFKDTEDNPCYCPLGLLPTATCPAPATKLAAGLLWEVESVRPFWNWWDQQTNAQEAVNAVWSKT